MPEGDTLRRLATRITERFAGQRCQRCVTRDPRLVGVDLAGATLIDADAYGKHLFVRFDTGQTLHAHLLMTGSFTVGPEASESVLHRRVELWMDDGRLSAIDVPLLGMIATRDEDEITAHLGPNLCASERPDLTEIVARMQRDPDAALAAAMLDQRHAAGFGNLYAVEVPFITGVSPNQPIGSIDDLAAIVSVGASLIRTNARLGPQNTTGRELHTQDRWIYAKRGRPCPICGGRLDGWDERASPWRRVSVWCPLCQPSAESRTADRQRARKLLALHPARHEPPFLDI